MLRRPPTALTLTTEDVTAYVEARVARAAAAAVAARAQNLGSNTAGGGGGGEGLSTGAAATNTTPQGSKTIDPNDELRPLPGDKARIVRTGLSRDERIGVGIGVGGGSGSGSGRR
jgi:hypothetical protein